MRYAVFGRNREHHVNLIGTGIPFHNLYSFLFRQLFQDVADPFRTGRAELASDISERSLHGMCSPIPRGFVFRNHSYNFGLHDKNSRGFPGFIITPERYEPYEVPQQSWGL